MDMESMSSMSALKRLSERVKAFMEGAEKVQQ